MSDAQLLSPFSLRKLELPNRIVVSPMGQYSADTQGRATDWHLVHLGGLALAGAGLLFTEATAVEPEGRISSHDLGIWSDDHLAPMRRVVDFCRQHGRTKQQLHRARCQPSHRRLPSMSGSVARLGRQFNRVVLRLLRAA